MNVNGGLSKMRMKIFKSAIVKIYYFYIDGEVVPVTEKSRRRAKKAVMAEYPHKPIIYIAKQKKRA